MLIKNSLILNNDFLEAFTGLMGMKMAAKQCLEVSSCIEDIMAQHQIIIRARRAVVDKYCSKDEDGKPRADEFGNILFDSNELQETCGQELKEIYDEEVDLALSKKIKISASELMTPLQMRLLKDVIEVEEEAC